MTDAEVSRLRDLLRDLVALSAIPSVWVERAAGVREPGTEAVAAGLADALVGLLQLDFAFVRLRDPGGAGAADVTRGGAWKRFPEWLESHLAAGTQFTGKELVADVGDGPQPCRGFVIPIGLHGEGGAVAAAAERSDFPTATEQLVLSLAANHAATAFHSARLVHERTMAEEDLREARNELEIKVAERAAELGRSEAYLAEAQRLTHTGSFAIDVSTREVSHSSDEHSRLYGFDPERGTPSLSEILQLIHPQDLALCTEALESGIRDATKIEVEYRVVLPQSPVRHFRVIAHPVFDPSGELDEFVGTIVDVTERREAETELERLAGEQTALRRVATLVAREASRAEIFTAIAEGIGQLLGTEEIRMLRYVDDRSAVVVASSGEMKDSFPIGTRQPLGGDNAASRVFRTGQPARIDDYERASGPIAEAVRPIGLRSAVATPIMVDGRIWGAMITGTAAEEPLPPETESRLGQFTELMATAIANTESRARADRLTEEQAALRRVATLVAEDVPAGELFLAVAAAAGALLGGDYTGMIRYEDDASVTTVATWAAVGEHPPAPERFHTEAGDPATMIAETLEAARVDDWTSVPGPIAAYVRKELGVTSSVGSPIVVEGRLWGALAIHSTKPTPLPPDTESRVQNFTELVGTAIANRSARTEVTRLAEEQAALRRVATLVAKESSPAEVFAKVAEELSNVLGDVDCSLFRDEGDGSASAVALWGASLSAGVRVGTRLPIDGDGVIASVLREGRPCRLGDYSAATGTIAKRGRELGFRSAIGCPIVVGGRIWGAMGAARYEAEAFPPETETRIAQFADLVATAIANAEARSEVERLADEQTALRRVATLVAEGASPTAVWDAVVGEMEALLDADQVALNRFEPGAKMSVLAHRGLDVERTPVGSRVSHEGESATATVRRTGRPARMEHREGAPGALAQLARTTGLRFSVGAPIVVDGRLWGIITASWKGEESPPAHTEERMAQFARLLDTAIANADSRAELMASRARLVAAADEARRRVVRDLHDGAQQRLVQTIMVLKVAQRALHTRDDETASLIGDALVSAEQGNSELRELAHGILPPILTHGGLRAGVRSLVEGLDLPVQVDVPPERFPAEIEASAYFIVAEALTNVAKHSRAARAEVKASIDAGMLHVEVRDDGIGGADPQGHGLVGLEDRAAALGGRLTIESPASGGTVLAATLPLSAS